MNNRAILTALGFQPNEQNPFYTIFDPSHPEPPRGFFAGPERAPLEEPYRAYREAVAAALAKADPAPEKVFLSLDRKALGHLARLLAQLPEPDAFQGLGRFLTAWDEHDGFDAFPDATLESEIAQWASEAASHWFDDLLKTLEGLGFEFEDYAFDPYGYDNYLKGRLTGYYTRETLERIKTELPPALAEVVRALYFEAARYDHAGSLLEDTSNAGELIGLVKKVKPEAYPVLLLHHLAGDEEGLERRLQEFEPDRLAEAVDEERLLANKALFSVGFDDRDENTYLHENAARLQRALRDWLEKEQEIDYARRLDWLTDRYDDGRLIFEPAETRAKAA